MGGCFICRKRLIKADIRECLFVGVCWICMLVIFASVFPF